MSRDKIRAVTRGWRSTWRKTSLKSTAVMTAEDAAPVNLEQPFCRTRVFSRGGLPSVLTISTAPGFLQNLQRADTRKPQRNLCRMYKDRAFVAGQLTGRGRGCAAQALVPSNRHYGAVSPLSVNSVRSRTRP